MKGNRNMKICFTLRSHLLKRQPVPGSRQLGAKKRESERKNKGRPRRGSPRLSPPSFFSRSFSLVPKYREPGTGYLKGRRDSLIYQQSIQRVIIVTIVARQVLIGNWSRFFPIYRPHARSITQTGVNMYNNTQRFLFELIIYTVCAPINPCIA